MWFKGRAWRAEADFIQRVQSVRRRYSLSLCDYSTESVSSKCFLALFGTIKVSGFTSIAQVVLWKSFLTLLSPSVQALAAAERARKQAETERDELSEELASNSSGK